MLYVTVLKIYISNYGYLFDTAMYVDYLTFSHLNSITNPTKVKEEVRYWTKDPVYKFVQMLHGAINGYNL